MATGNTKLQSERGVHQPVQGPAVQEKAGGLAAREIAYIPLGENTEIVLTVGMVRRFLAVPTKSGKLPSDAEIIKFCMLCKARRLNPWVGDAYLVGYDSKDGPQFSLITAHQSLLKRAAVPLFDGMESGVIVERSNGELLERPGDFMLPTEKLVGGWAVVYRKDQKHPTSERLNRSVYDTERSRWAKDPAGMIVKCAESSALRKAFPLELGGLYTADEMEAVADTEQAAKVKALTDKAEQSALDNLADMLERKAGKTLAVDKPAESAGDQVAESDVEPDPDAPGILEPYFNEEGELVEP